MRALIIAVTMAAVGLGCGGDEGSSATSASQLRITVWPAGREAGDARRWTLRCGPAGGTLPNAGRACTRLAALERPFRPVPADIVCTQVYGGPEEALVTGTYRGARIWARFNRQDGCQISRWNRLAFLFPVPVGESADA